MSWHGDMLKAGIASNGNDINVFGGNIAANNFPSMAHKTLYVDSNNGLDTYSGNSLSSAKATIQAAVTIANSSKYATQNVDIFVLGGIYTEVVNFSRTGTELGDAVMLWQSGGTNIGLIGTIRVIAVGTVFLTGLATSVFPTISIGRPNVEIHNFATIKMISDEDISEPWTAQSGSTVNHVGMPAVFVEDNYNYNHDGVGGGTLLYGAGNNVLINNCRINGGGKTNGGAVCNYGSKWIHVKNCLMEYGNAYGFASVGSQKGTCAECLTEGCTFQQNTDCDLMHGNNVIHWVRGCNFPSLTVTAYLVKNGPGGASILCAISDCSIAQDTLAEMVSAGNAGWAASGIRTGGVAGSCIIGNEDLAA